MTDELTEIGPEDLERLGLKAKKRDEDILGESIKRPPNEIIERLIVILLDSSGSMAGNFEPNRTKIVASWSALKEQLFPNLAGHHLGIISFGSYDKISGTWANVTKWEVYPGSDAQKFLDSPVPVADGNTPMLHALQEAWDFIGKWAKQARFILMSDGEPNDAPKEEILRMAGEHDTIPIDCVGIGIANSYDYDPDFLRQLALITGGIFVEVRSIKELTSMIEKLAPVNRPLLGTVEKQLPE